MKPINETPVSSDAAYERETVINFCDAEKKHPTILVIGRACRNCATWQPNIPMMLS